MFSWNKTFNYHSSTLYSTFIWWFSRFRKVNPLTMNIRTSFGAEVLILVLQFSSHAQEIHERLIVSQEWFAIHFCDRKECSCMGFHPRFNCSGVVRQICGAFSNFWTGMRDFDITVDTQRRIFLMMKTGSFQTTTFSTNWSFRYVCICVQYRR